jgi:peptidoglycan-associated lipoprotein
MRKSTVGVLTGAAVVIALGMSGCATKTYVDEKVAEAVTGQNAKVAEVQKQVEANQQDISNLKTSDAAQNEKLAQLSDTAREALDRATEAGKLAKGKFIMEVTLTDNDVHFGFDKAELSKEAKSALDAFAEKVKGMDKNVYIEIQGNTDNIGSDKYNLKLGQMRADNVMRYLNMEQGIPLNRMSAVSYGEYKPIADNKTREGRAQNRRVTLVVLE